MKKSSGSYYPSVDGVRAIAVLAVIFFHLDFHLFSGGYVGVDMFFVVSGYLITRNIFLALETNTFSLLNFYSARVRRLFLLIRTQYLNHCFIFGHYRLKSNSIYSGQ